ncbi:hypothetical protein FRC04_005414 [Tulasnella sp. 424]|nr:hypothetical protein FRC04_005414 [Tulasnella sp. 424]KAG8962587.1 hypothetical protein FRC05_005266 [Tulasnella sp. 425]
MRPTRPAKNYLIDDLFSIDMDSSEDIAAAVFWDHKRCPPPPGMSGAIFASRIRDEMCAHSANRFALFKVYTTVTDPIPEPFKTELKDSGAQICEGDGLTADKIRRTVDILTWALTVTHPVAVLFITDDPDFASLLSALGNKRCTVSLLLHPNARSSVLVDHAANVLDWNQVFNRESNHHTGAEALIDLSSDDREMPRSTSQAGPTPSQAPRRIDLPAPNHHPLAILQHPLLGSPSRPQHSGSPQQDTTPSSSGTARAGIAGPSDQPAVEQIRPSTSPPNQPLRSPELFKHLVDVLTELNAQTSREWHAWGTVGDLLNQRDPDVYQRLGLGFRRFKPYIGVASKEANIVSIKEPRGGDGEVSLNAREVWNVAAY